MFDLIIIYTLQMTKLNKHTGINLEKGFKIFLSFTSMKVFTAPVIYWGSMCDIKGIKTEKFYNGTRMYHDVTKKTKNIKRKDKNESIQKKGRQKSD